MLSSSRSQRVRHNLATEQQGYLLFSQHKDPKESLDQPEIQPQDGDEVSKLLLVVFYVFS